jgi:site-specific DNA recombinase
MMRKCIRHKPQKRGENSTYQREVTGERIRDKIAASKRKGLWMGGQPSLGYDVRDRKLLVNEAEARPSR